MSHLLRRHAPLTDAAWGEIDDEARRQLSSALAGRRLVDFAGPYGWDYAATPRGRTIPLAGAPAEGLRARQRVVLAAVELRADFSLSREELADVDRGASDPDLDALAAAARRLALAENLAVLHGWAEAGITGVTAASPHAPIALGRDYAEYPGPVSQAVEVLRQAGVDGPFALALGPDAATGVLETTEHGGLVVLDHLRRILDGPVVWAPGVEGAVLVSRRGGDFSFQSGQDLSVGYSGHDADQVHLYLEESFTFVVNTPEAGIALT